MANPAPDPLETDLATAVLNLALPGEAVLALMPGKQHPADQLAFAFEAAYTAYITRLDRLPAANQLAALQGLDAALSSMTGKENAALWTPKAVKTHPRWQKVRQLAQAAVDAFGWQTA